MFYTSSGLSKNDLGDKAAKSIDDFTEKIQDNFITKYEIGEVELKDDEATVSVKTTHGYNPYKLDDINVDSEVNKIANKYMEKHMDELTNLYDSKGKKALMKNSGNAGCVLQEGGRNRRAEAGNPAEAEKTR